MLFVALLAAMLDLGSRRYPQWALAAVFAAALVVSHYARPTSPSSMIGIAVVLQWVAVLAPADTPRYPARSPSPCSCRSRRGHSGTAR